MPKEDKELEKIVHEHKKEQSIKFIDLMTGGDLASNLAELQKYPKLLKVDGRDLDIGFSDSPLARSYLEKLSFHIAIDHDDSKCSCYRAADELPKTVVFGDWLCQEKVQYYAMVLSDTMLEGLLEKTAELVQELLNDVPHDAKHVNWSYRSSCIEKPLKEFIDNYSTGFAYY